MEKIEIKVINKSIYPLPEYKTPGSVGMDLRANLDKPLLLHSLDRAIVPTGLYIQLPEGYEAQVRPRSGLAIKHGISCPNTPGTIDFDYRGEVGVEIINLSKDDYTIQPGDRIVQMVINKVAQADWKLVTELDETERGEGGYGHTGK